MRALVDVLVLKCLSKIAKDLSEDYRSPSQIAAVGKYTRESAEKRIDEFLENANSQLALMVRQRSRRAAERKAMKLRNGMLEEPGKGLPIWPLSDVADHVVDQIQLTEDWTGERVATVNVDDHKIANDCALRPRANPGPETLTRQSRTARLRRSWRRSWRSPVFGAPSARLDRR